MWTTIPTSAGVLRRLFSPLAADDLRAMQRAVERTWTPLSRWHVGDLAWGRYSGPDGDRPAALWWDGPRVMAWAWSELGVYVDPGHPELAGEVLGWFGGGPVTVLDREEHLVGALRRSGHRAVEEAPFFRHCVIDLDSLAVPELPGGYRVRPVRAGEAAARAAVHRAAWRPGRVGRLFVPPVDLGPGDSAMNADTYQAVMDAWPYRRDLDLVVQAPDGALAASALGWLDEVNRVGELEPVGTDPRHERRGLAAAVSLACLHALRAAGATRAVVYPRGDDRYPTPLRLYRRLGFRPVGRTVTYAR
jgi:predicted N-acetyltransferase YhbS